MKYFNCTERPEVLDVGVWRDHIASFAAGHRLWSPCLAAGWERDDLLQFVCMGVHRRQSMPSRYNPRKGTVGKYLHIVTRSLLSHAWEQASSRSAAVSRASVSLDVDVEDAAPAPEGQVIEAVVLEVERRHPRSSDAVRRAMVEGSTWWLTPAEAGTLRRVLVARCM